jgi:hypothetical protein
MLHERDHEYINRILAMSLMARGGIYRPLEVDL